MLIPSRAPHPISDHTDLMQLRQVGPHAVLIEVSDTSAAHRVARWVMGTLGGFREVVPAAGSVLVDGLADPEVLVGMIPEITAAAATAAGTPSLETGPTVSIPVTYDGPDLVDIARAWQLSADDVVRRHTSIEFVSAFCGFSPGFAYLEGLPAGSEVARLTTPRTRVPAGSVALADRWCAVYPSSSPGGWRIIGTTSANLWDQNNSQPALLPPGTRVRFCEARGAEG